MKPFKINSFVEYFEPLKIDTAKCVLSKSFKADCYRCQYVCPVKALELKNGLWDAVGCIYCGKCVAVCPTDVFQIDETLLLQRSNPETILYIGCQHNEVFSTKQHSIQCLQQFKPELILQLLMKNKAVVIGVNQEKCESCDKQWFAEGLQKQLERFHLPLERLYFFTTTEEIEALKESLQEKNQVNRREYFSTLGKQVGHTGEGMIRQEIKKIPLAQSEVTVPRRFRLQEAYQKSNPKGEETLPYPMLEVQQCRFCEACVKLCPTQALKIFSDENEQKHLLFHPALCQQCQLCEKVCMEKGIFWGDFISQSTFFKGQWQEVARGNKKVCSVCEDDFWYYEKDQERTVCPYCDIKKRG